MAHVSLFEAKKWSPYAMLFVLFFVSYGYFFQGGGWNQNSRICLTRALIDQRSFKIDCCKEDSQEMEFVNTGDWAYRDGHYYSNKSPGLSFMAVPPFALTRYFLKDLVPDDPERQILLSSYVGTLCTTVLLSVLLCLLIFHVFHHLLQMSIENAFFLTLLYGFGTLAFSYSTTFYCHQPAAFCSFLAFVLVLHVRRGSSQKKKPLALLAGFSAASAVLIEPSAFLTLVVIAAAMLFCKEERKYLPLFFLGCFPLGIVQAAYNFVCFGHPLASSYSYANDMVMWEIEGKLFGVPNLRRFYDLLFSPYRGLFFSSPILLMALPGSFLFLRDKKVRAEATLCITVVLFYSILIAGFHAWHGGSTVGPRYLLPAVPFAFFLTALSLRKYPKLFTVIGFLSVFINLSITLVGNEIPREIKNPLFDVVLKSLLGGEVSINPVPFSNFQAYPGVIELARVENWMPNFNSFNLGELLFPHSVASVLPLLCFWIIWWYGWKKCIA